MTTCPYAATDGLHVHVDVKIDKRHAACLSNTVPVQSTYLTKHMQIATACNLCVLLFLQCRCVHIW